MYLALKELRVQYYCTISSAIAEVCRYYTGSPEEGVFNFFICAKGIQEAFYRKTNICVEYWKMSYYI